MCRGGRASRPAGPSGREKRARWANVAATCARFLVGGRIPANTNVDAPEKRTRGGAAATRALEHLIKGETVTIDTVARDRYGRSVARVKVGRKSVNSEMRKKTK